MKKSRFRETLNDLKAAVRIGHPEALDVALDGLRSLPQVAGNERLGEGFIEQVVYPAGKILSQMPARKLMHLLEEPAAAMRAIGAVAFARRYLLAEDGSPKQLRAPAGDARPEVRHTLGETLREVGEACPERLLPLAEDWLAAPSPLRRASALNFLPALATEYPQQLLDWLVAQADDQAPEVRAALVDTLRRTARAGLAEAVLRLLAAWAQAPRLNVWVITRAISDAWATAHPQEVRDIIHTVYQNAGESKDLNNAIQALGRRGLDIDLIS